MFFFFCVCVFSSFFFVFFAVRGQGARLDDVGRAHAGHQPSPRAAAAVHAQESQDRGHGTATRKGSLVSYDVRIVLYRLHV